MLVYENKYQQIIYIHTNIWYTEYFQRLINEISVHIPYNFQKLFEATKKKFNAETLSNCQSWKRNHNQNDIYLQKYIINIQNGWATYD